jgi:hypothetical protein
VKSGRSNDISEISFGKREKTPMGFKLTPEKAGRAVFSAVPAHRNMLFTRYACRLSPAISNASYANE